MKPQTFHFIANKCLYSIAVGTNWLIHSFEKETPKILPIKTRTNNNNNHNNELEVEENSTSSVAVGCNSICVDEFFFVFCNLSLISSLVHFQVDFFVQIHALFVVFFHSLSRNWFRFSWNFVEFIHFCFGNSVFPIWLSESN